MREEELKEDQLVWWLSSDPYIITKVDTEERYVELLSLRDFKVTRRIWFSRVIDISYIRLVSNEHVQSYLKSREEELQQLVNNAKIELSKRTQSLEGYRKEVSEFLINKLGLNQPKA